MPSSGLRRQRAPGSTPSPLLAAARDRRAVWGSALAVTALSACTNVPIGTTSEIGNVNAALHADPHTISHAVYRPLHNNGPDVHPSGAALPVVHAPGSGPAALVSRRPAPPGPPHNASHIPTPVDNPWALGLLALLLGWMLWLDGRSRPRDKTDA